MEDPWLCTSPPSIIVFKLSAYVQLSVGTNVLDLLVLGWGEVEYSYAVNNCGLAYTQEPLICGALPPYALG